MSGFCQCPDLDAAYWQQLIIDQQRPTQCRRCNAVWHYCVVHQKPVPGFPTREHVCTCTRVTGTLSGACPRCRSTWSTQPDPYYATRECQQCQLQYHICPLHGESIEGPGFLVKSLSNQQCQCHANLSFLKPAQWSSPFK